MARPRLPSRALVAAIGVAVLGGLVLQPVTASSSESYEQGVVGYANNERARAALTVVERASCLDRFAVEQAQAMVASGRMYHQSMGPILTACGLSQVGENVAFGYPDAASVTAAWLASESHRRNLLNTRHRLIGVGAAQDAAGNWYVSEVFGRASAESVE